MTPKTKKILLIIIPVILVAIIATTLTILYVTTDFLKTDKTLFLKYFSQNVDIAKTIMDNTDEKEFTNKLRQNKYESKTELSGGYTEKVNTSEENKNNEINKIKIVSENQSDYPNNYNYKNIKIVNGDADAFQAELISENNVVGFRFPEEFNQFIAVENQNIKQEAQKTGLTDEQIELIPDQIEEYDYTKLLSFSDEEIATLKEKYLTIIDNNISSDKYSRQKNAMITVNENSYNTTAFSVILTQEQVNNLYIKLLEKLSTDEIILNKIDEFEKIAILYNKVKENGQANNNHYLQDLFTQQIQEKIEEITENNIGTNEVKYTVYALNGKIIRTQIFENNQQTTIDYIGNDNDLEIKIQNIIANDEQENQNNLYIVKKVTNEQTEKSLKIENILGDNTTTKEISRKKEMSETEATVKNEIQYNDGKSNIFSLKLNETIEFKNEIERKIELNEQNHVLTNDYDEEHVTKWVSMVNEFIQKKLQDNKETLNNIRKVKPIGKLLGEPTEEPIVQQEEEAKVTDIDKNRFNARFEFYTGNEKSYEEVIQLLDEAKTSLKGVQVGYSNEGTTQENKKLQAIKLTMENGTKNEEMVNELKTMLEPNGTFTVEITKNASGLVETIMITMNR